MTTFTPLLLPKVLDNTKTHTYRQRHEGDRVSRDAQGCITEIRDAKGRLKWKVGKRYSVQPGRGKKGVGRFFTVTSLDECADVRHIDDAMARREGFASRLDFWKLWTKLYLPKVNRVLESQTPEMFKGQSWQAVEDWAADYLMLCEPAEKFGPVWGISFEVAR